MPRPPYVRLDDNLSVFRCGGSEGCKETLLRTYFSGHERCKAGTNTCFQIAMLNEDPSWKSGAPVRTYLRFIEMACPSDTAKGANLRNSTGMLGSQQTLGH